MRKAIQETIVETSNSTTGSCTSTSDDSTNSVNAAYKLSSSINGIFRIKAVSSPIKKVPARRIRIGGRKVGKDAFLWAKNQPYNGYIKHPDAKWLMHPSFFENNKHKLCPFNGRCTHKKDCGQLRLNMAAMSYIRNKNCTSFRDMEIIWGVSRSTIQRRARSIKRNKESDITVLLC